MMHTGSSFTYSRVVTNSISNLVGYVARAAVGFFLVRYVVRQLGPEQYSLVPLVGSVMAYLLLLNLGTGLGMARHISAAHARGEEDEVSRVFTSMFLVMAGIGAVLLAAGLVLSWQFSSIFTVPPGLHSAAVLLVCLTTVASALQMPFNVLQSAFVATESYVLSNAIGAGSDVLRAAITVALFEFLGSWVVWTAVAQLIVVVATTACQWYVVRRILPSARIKLSLFNARVAVRVMAFSLAAFVGTVSGILYWDTDKIVINKFLAPKELTLYAVVTAVAISVYQLMNVPTTVLFPVIARAEATNNIHVVRQMVYRGTRLCVLVSLPGWLLFAALAQPFFRWYLGGQYQSVASFVPFLAAATFFGNATSIIRLVPVPMGRPLFISVAELGFGLLNLAITVIAVGWFHWGLAGVAFGTLVAISIKNTALQPWYVAHLIDLSLRALLRNTTLAAVPTAIAGVTLLGLGKAFTGFGTAWFAIPAGLASAVFLVCFYMIGLPPEERHRVGATLEAARRAMGQLGR